MSDKSEWIAGRGGSRWDRTSLFPSVTYDSSTGIVTLSIVNYMIYHSNGCGFRMGGERNPRPTLKDQGWGTRRRGTHPLSKPQRVGHLGGFRVCHPPGVLVQEWSAWRRV